MEAQQAGSYVIDIHKEKTPTPHPHTSNKFVKGVGWLWVLGVSPTQLEKLRALVGKKLAVIIGSLCV